MGQTKFEKAVFTLMMCFCMVVGMVLCMSMYGAIVAVGFTPAALKLYPLCVLRNFVMPLPLNMLVVSPLVRFLFGKMFKAYIRKPVSH